MKKFFCTILVLILMISLAATAFAESVERYYISEIGVSVEIPSRFTVSGRNCTDDDIAAALWMDSAEELNEYMLDNDAWLRAADGYELFEVTAFSGADDIGPISRDGYDVWEELMVSIFADDDGLLDCQYMEINGRSFVYVYAWDCDEDDPYEYVELWTTEGDNIIYLYYDCYPYSVDDEGMDVLVNAASSLSFDGEVSIPSYTPDTSILTPREDAPSMSDGDSYVSDKGSSALDDLDLDLGLDKVGGYFVICAGCVVLQILTALFIHLVRGKKAMSFRSAIITAAAFAALNGGLLLISGAGELSWAVSGTVVSAAIAFEILNSGEKKQENPYGGYGY